MRPITELTDIQREVLRHIFFAPDHTADLTYVADRCYYPDQAVQDTLRDLRTSGYLRTEHETGNRTYTPTAEALAQMQALNRTANANLHAGVAEALSTIPSQPDHAAPDGLPTLLVLPSATYHLDEWMTFTAYSEKYQISVAAIGMRVMRGNIPPAHVLEIPRWGIKLLKDVAPDSFTMGRKPKNKA
ncbi:winged helix DNA-binding protein [Fibrella sp. ES10-3-2-2]|nr:hypothetical protein A6C57_00460 [Fibrella sp. ES10-3-2-2]